MDEGNKLNVTEGRRLQIYLLHFQSHDDKMLNKKACGSVPEASQYDKDTVQMFKKYQ